MFIYVDVFIAYFPYLKTLKYATKIQPVFTNESLWSILKIFKLTLDFELLIHKMYVHSSIKHPGSS